MRNDLPFHSPHSTFLSQLGAPTTPTPSLTHNTALRHSPTLAHPQHSSQVPSFTHPPNTPLRPSPEDTHPPSLTHHQAPSFTHPTTTLLPGPLLLHSPTLTHPQHSRSPPSLTHPTGPHQKTPHHTNPLFSGALTHNNALLRGTYPQHSSQGQEALCGPSACTFPRSSGGDPRSH